MGLLDLAALSHAENLTLIDLAEPGLCRYFDTRERRTGTDARDPAGLRSPAPGKSATLPKASLPFPLPFTSPFYLFIRCSIELSSPAKGGRPDGSEMTGWIQQQGETPARCHAACRTRLHLLPPPASRITARARLAPARPNRKRDS